MADFDNTYYKVGGVDAQYMTSGRWFKVGVAFIGGALLGFLSIAAMSTPTLPNNTAIESTSLLSMSPLASPELLKGLGDSPIKMPALLAIQAFNSDSRVRDVRMKAVRSAMAEFMDEESKERLSFMGDRVKEVALKMPGITAPTGYFDPLGFSTKCSLGTLLFWREAELKHGRLGMLASLGIIAGEKFGPILGAKSVPAAVALQDTPMGKFCYSYEQVAGEKWWEGKEGTMPADLIPGDYGWDPLNLKPKSANEFLDMQNRELNNGRLAMLAASGIVLQEIVTGKKIF